MPQIHTANNDATFEKFNVLYAFIFLGVLIAHIPIPALPFWPLFLWLVKPLIMISLGYLFVRMEGPLLDKKNLAFLGAIVASFLGDVILLFPGELPFLMGVAAFFIAQFMYAWVFAQEGSWKVFKEIGIIFIIGYGVGFIHFLWPHLDFMRIPIIIYSAAITLMGICALSRKNQVSRRSFGWVVIGAFFFILSDSLIAINRFAFDIPLHQYTVMATYMLAQYLIVIGYIRR